MGEWLDGKREADHNCLNERPRPKGGDIGRRWRCSCGNVYRVNTSLDQRSEPIPGWTKA